MSIEATHDRKAHAEYTKVMDLPVAIVTGAGSGIGQAVSVRLAQAGWRVALVGRTKSTLAATTERVRGLCEVPLTIEIVADVSEPGAAEAIVERSIAEWGRVDALVNNAAALAVQPIEQADVKTLTAIFAANLFGPAQLISAVWPHFASRRSGVVVNLSSMATVSPFPGLGLYAASKAALESLTRSIAVEGARLGIRAFSVAPGAVETAMLRTVVSAETLPTERTLKPEVVAAVIMQCIAGTRDGEAGTVVLVPSP